VSVSLKIKIFEPSGTRILNVQKSSLTIGSASHCDIVLDHATVSPEHTRAWIESGRIWIQDLGSPSGTALNDIRLPALKPMLVRDLDVLRLGESPSTLGLEAITVRAPVVKLKATEPTAKEAAPVEAKALSNVEFEKKREEAETLAREVADLRLQLQMATLEKSSADEMSQQLTALREETQRVQDQRIKWDESLRQIEEEKASLRKKVEAEMADFRAKTLADFKKAAGAEANQQAFILHEQIKALQTERDGLEGKLQQTESDKLSLRRKLEQDIAEVKARSEADLKRVEGHESGEVARLLSQIKKIESERSSLEDSVAKVEAEKQALRKGLERELAEVKTKSAAEIKRLTAEVEHFADLQAQIKKLQGEKQELSESLRTSERTWTEKLRAVNTVKEDKTGLYEQIEKLQGEKHALSETLRASERSWAEKLRAADVEKLSLRKAFDKELTEFKSKSVNEIKKAASSEANEQAAAMREEIEKLHQQRHLLSESLRETEGERDTLRHNLKKGSAGDTQRLNMLSSEVKKLNEQRDADRKLYERELAEAKAMAFKDANSIMLQEQQRTEAWKHDAVDSLARQLQKFSQQVARTFATQPVTLEIVREWESDVVQFLRKVILSDADAAPRINGRQRADAAPPEATVLEKRDSRESRRARRRREARASQMWRSVAMACLILALALAGVWMGSAYFRQRGARSLSSQAPVPALTPVTAKVPDHKPPERPHRYEPKMSKKYRSSYTDNVLYLENYVGAEENIDFHKRWLLELNKVASSDWKIDSWTLAPVAVEEQSLIQDLSRMKGTIMTDKIQEGVNKMHAREDKFMHDLDGVFKNRAGTERYLKFKRAFYLRNQAYLTSKDQ